MLKEGAGFACSCRSDVMPDSARWRGFSETGRGEEKRRMKSNLVSGLKEGKMRYLLVLLLMIAVGGDALAQAPRIAFEPSSGSLPNFSRAAFEGEVTEGGSIDIKIQSVDEDGSNPVAANSNFDVKYKVTRNNLFDSGIWHFDFPVGSEQTVEFEAGQTETTLTLNIRDDDVLLRQQEAYRYLVKIQENDPFYVPYTRPSSRYEVIVTDNDSFPVVGFKTAQSDAMESPAIPIPHVDGVPTCPEGYKRDESNAGRCVPVHTITLTSARAIRLLEGETSFPVALDITAVDPANDHWPFRERETQARFAEGKKEAMVEFTLIDDNLVQSSLEYKLTIQPSEHGFVLGDNNEHTILWMDNDAARVPTVSFKGGGSSTVVEGDPVEITLALDKAHEAGETCPDDDPDDMLDPTEDCLNVSVEIIPENPDGDTRWPFIGTFQTASFAAGETEGVLSVNTVDADDDPSPPQTFTLSIVPDPDITPERSRRTRVNNMWTYDYEDGYPRQDYQVGTDKERTVNWEDKEAVWLDIAPARDGFSVTPNKAAVSDYSYKIEWKAEATSPATINGMTEDVSGELEWDAGGMDTKMVELSYDCSSTGKVEISIESARCSSFEGTDMNAVCFFDHQPGEDLSNVEINVENVLLRGTGDADETGLAEDLCEMAERQSRSSGGTPGGDDPMDPPDSSDDPMDPEVASDSDGGCSLSGGSGLNQLASNAVAMGLVLMFGLCLVLRGERRNVSDSLR